MLGEREFVEEQCVSSCPSSVCLFSFSLLWSLLKCFICHQRTLGFSWSVAPQAGCRSLIWQQQRGPIGGLERQEQPLVKRCHRWLPSLPPFFVIPPLFRARLPFLASCSLGLHVWGPHGHPRVLSSAQVDAGAVPPWRPHNGWLPHRHKKAPARSPTCSFGYWSTRRGILYCLCYVWRERHHS